DINLVEGNLAQFKSERDSALVGKAFADRRGLEVGEKFVFGEIAVKVVGIFESPLPMEENIILTHLEFLQRAGPVGKLGTVTQFEVKVKDAGDSKRVAAEIDALFATAEEPTDTHSQLAFVESATRDLRDLLSFGRIFGVACVLVILILVGNTVMMSVGERVREFGLLRTLGFQGRHLVAIVLGESTLIALLGAGIGVGGAIGAIAAGDFAFGVEGVQISFSTAPAVILRGVLMAVVLSTAVSIIPAWRAAVRPVVRALRGT
ncbi:MAG: FtsX-like permease family protein, partial [Planctomycetota bacterium]